jgi:hypothetical protein
VLNTGRDHGKVSGWGDLRNRVALIFYSVVGVCVRIVGIRFYFRVNILVIIILIR